MASIARFSFQDAVHDDVHLIIGLSGPSGGGKSHTAMRMAWGIQQYLEETTGECGPIALIDTDNGRGRMLAPRSGEPADPPNTFDMKYLRMPPPFTPMHMLEAIEAAAVISPSVLVIDNITDEWFGDGGIIEMVDSEQAKGGNQFGAWRAPKKAHRRFVAALRQLQCPVILTIKAEDKYVLRKGSATPVHVGWTPRLEKDMPGDFTFHFLVGVGEAPGRLIGSREEFDYAKAGIGAMGLVKDGELGDENIGKRLAAWAAGAKVESAE